MGPRIHRRVSLGDGAIRIDHVGDALSRAVGAVSSAVGQTDAAVGVAQQQIRKVVSGGEGGVLLDAVGADTENLNVLRFVVLDSITESLPLGRSARRVGHRVEPEDDLPAGVIAKLDLRPRMGGDGEAGRLVPYLEHLFLLDAARRTTARLEWAGKTTNWVRQCRAGAQTITPSPHSLVISMPKPGASLGTR